MGKGRCLVVGNSATMRQEGMGSLERKVAMTDREGGVTRRLAQTACVIKSGPCGLVVSEDVLVYVAWRSLESKHFVCP